VRKNAASVVLALVSIILSGPATARPAGGAEDPRIVSSLAEAAPDPLRPAVLVFFSLDCHVCWEELFEMRYFLQKNSIPIDLIGVTMDKRGELEPFLRKYAFFHPVVSDRQRQLYRRFRVRLEPATVIIQNDRILYHDGPVEAYFARKEKVRKCLLEIAAKSPF
jgi:peroxiredoxin